MKNRCLLSSGLDHFYVWCPKNQRSHQQISKEIQIILGFNIWKMFYTGRCKLSNVLKYLILLCFDGKGEDLLAPQQYHVR